MVKVKDDGQAGSLNSRLNELYKVGVVRIGSCALGNLKDQGSVELGARLNDTLDYLHVVYVESAYGVAALIGILKHFGACY